MNDLQLSDQLNKMIAKERRERVKTTPQLTLGELIDKLEPLLEKQEAVKEKYGDEATVEFDFEYAIPTGLSSWRGSYAELAITFNFLGYDYFGKEKPKEMLLSTFIAMLKGAIGKEYTGWKGGEFIMSRDTPIWVSNDGNAGETGVVDVIDNEYSIILVTQRCEY